MYGGCRPAAIGGISKRLVDLTLAAFALILLMPLLIVVGVLIRLLVGKPAIVSANRIGFAGKIFAQYRFRTTPGTGALPAHRIGASFAEALQASGMDTLPSIYNVVVGDMSWVGPQPGLPAAALNDAVEAPEVLQARPGLTGMRHHVPHSLRARAAQLGADSLYVLHWSMWLDLKIVSGALARLRVEDAITPIR